jgi:hypothetical protein
VHRVEASDVLEKLWQGVGHASSSSEDSKISNRSYQLCEVGKPKMRLLEGSGISHSSDIKLSGVGWLSWSWVQATPVLTMLNRVY